MGRAPVGVGLWWPQQVISPSNLPGSALAAMAKSLELFEDNFGVPQMPMPDAPTLEGVTATQTQPKFENPEFGSEAAKFWVDPFTGNLHGRLKLPVSPGRQGFAPSLELAYSSAAANGPFGLGWSLHVGAVELRVREGEHGEVHSEYFLDGRPLIPALDASAEHANDESVLGDYTIKRFRRVVQTTKDRIELWTNSATQESHWRVIDPSNVTTLYGPSETSRIQDPADSKRVSHWLVSESYDDRGNIIRYGYKHENLEGVDLTEVHESHRNHVRGTGGWRYPKRISYGNRAPHSRDMWHFHLVFDYGDHDHDDPRVEDVQQWEVRPDPFSRFDSGFEQRIWRRCTRVLMFHRFDQLGSRSVLVSSLDLSYDASRGESQLASATRTGFVHRYEGFEPERATEPPISFSYHPLVAQALVGEVDSVALTNVLGEEARNASWVDLYGEGLPGVISRLGDKWLYLRNLGDGRFDDPDEVADAEVPPDLTEAFSFGVKEESVAHQSEYQPTASYSTPRDLNAGDPRLCYMDLNGDGVDDVIAATASTLRWYPSHGEDGYGECVQVSIKPHDLGGGVRLGFGEDASFHAADMTGDGLVDLVRIDRQTVTYWPNLGQGNFGQPITTELPESLNEGSGRRCLLASVGGSARADLLFIGEGTVTWYENVCGNGWKAGVAIEAQGLHPNALGLDAIDLFGNGIRVLIWVDKSTRMPKSRFVSFTNPSTGLLAACANGKGLETRFGYSTATEQWLRDRRGGLPWLDVLPVARKVVERVEDRDHVGGTRDGARFAFHHPSYDTARGQFVGFAFTESWLGLSDDEYGQAGLFDDIEIPETDEARRSPVAYVKTWHHTGIIFEDAELTVALKDAFFDDVTLGRARWLTGPKLPLNQAQSDIFHSHKAMTGRLVRREIYGADGPPLQALPYLVEEWTSRVDELQPSRGSVPPALAVSLNESVRVIYERDTADPRVSHVINVGDVDSDEFERLAFVEYAPQRPTLEAQKGAHVVVVETRLTQATTSPSFHRADVPIDSQSWQLVFANPPTASRLLEAREIRSAFDELKTVDPVLLTNGPHKKLVSSVRWRYWANNCKSLLPVGVIESRCLLARVEQLALTTPAVEELYGSSRIDSLRFEGGYLVEDDNWWAPGPTVNFDPSLFYLPVSRLDALGREVRLAWNESGMFPQRRTVSGGPIAFMDWHPRTLKIWRFGDRNGNVRAWRFGPLGEVTSITEMGSAENPTGDSVVMSTHESSSGDNPTQVVVVDRNAWLLKHEPVSVRSRRRVTHGGRPSKLEDVVTYVDAKGEFLTKAVKDGESWIAIAASFSDSRGQVTALSTEAVKGSLLPGRGPQSELRSRSTWFTRDCLGRVVRVDNPNGTFRLVQYLPWQVANHDENDTVLDSQWYAKISSASRGRAGDFAARQAAGVGEQMRSAALSASHARTPTVSFLNSSGREVGVRTAAASGLINETITELDVVGFVARRIDGRNIVTSVTTRDLLKRELCVSLPLNMTTKTQWSAAGDKLRCIYADGTTVAYRYDTLGQLVEIVGLTKGEPDKPLRKVIWGSGDVAVDDPQDRNLAGYPHVVVTESGIQTVVRRDYMGRPEVVQYRMLPPGKEMDWTAFGELTHVQQVELASKELGLEAPFSVMRQYDAIGNVSAIRCFDKLQVQGEFEKAQSIPTVLRVSAQHGLARQVVVRNVEAPGGKVASLEVGEDEHIQYGYDELGRRTEVTYSSGEKIHYKERVAVDAVGRITSVSNNDETIRAYVLDGCDRLTTAEIQHRDDWPDPERSITSFEWNASNNLVKVIKGGGTKEPLFEFRTDPTSNRLDEMYVFDGEDKFAKAIVHNSRGSITQVGDDLNVEFNELGQLTIATNGRITVAYQYGIDGSVLRRVATNADGSYAETVFVDNCRRVRQFDSANTLITEETHADIAVGGVRVAKVVYAEPANGEHFTSIELYRESLMGETVEEVQGDNTSRISYLPFGAALLSEERAFIMRGFRGAFQDVEVGLVLLDGDWYSPLLGRWLTDAVGRKTRCGLFKL